MICIKNNKRRIGAELAQTEPRRTGFAPIKPPPIEGGLDLIGAIQIRSVGNWRRIGANKRRSHTSKSQNTPPGQSSDERRPMLNGRLYIPIEEPA
jgi:hypothetical protein